MRELLFERSSGRSSRRAERVARATLRDELAEIGEELDETVRLVEAGCSPISLGALLERLGETLKKLEGES